MLRAAVKLVAVAVAVLALGGGSPSTYKGKTHGGRTYEPASGAATYGPQADGTYTPTFPEKILKRGSPNDFWFAYGFDSDDGNLATGDVFAARPDTSPYLWYLGDDYMDVDRAWGIITSSPVGVVVVDQEVAVNHYDLAANIYSNPGEIPGNGVDDDGNGLIDDVNGWDEYSWDNNPEISSADGDDFALAITEGFQHGTQMAAFIGAVGNNEGFSSPPAPGMQGSVGILWDVPILPIAVQGGNGVRDREYRTFTEDLGSDHFAMEYAADLGDFRVVNESFLGQTEISVNAAKYHGMLLMCGAGNTNGLRSHAYAAVDDVACVIGAVNSEGKTGNTDESTSGAQDGSMSFSTEIDFLGYSTPGRSYWAGSDRWHTPDSSTELPFYVLGYNRSVPTEPRLDWLNNLDTAAPATDPIYNAFPSEGFTSGATAQASALASMVLGLYPELSVYQARGMMERGCVTDVFDGRNSDQCDSGDCDGYLGFGRMSAYRSITLWGVVSDTTFSGDVYVSGDVEIAGTCYIDPGTTFHIAPYDLYQQEIDNGALTCQAQYEIDHTGFTSVDPDEITIYITGTLLFSLGDATFKSNAVYPGSNDWGGIYTEGAGFFFAGGNLSVENTTGGEY